MNGELTGLLEKIKKFRDERDWKQFHNHKDMAISIALEANELLERFQWKNEKELDEVANEKRAELEEELADIFIYLLEFSDNVGINLIKAAEKKLQKNAEKYPVFKSKGSSTKYNRL